MQILATQYQFKLLGYVIKILEQIKTKYRCVKLLLLP